MIYLILCILSSTLIFILFKFIDRFSVEVLPVIIYNYLVASMIGFAISGQGSLEIVKTGASWLPISIGIGILFILMFLVIGKSSQKAGISVTTVASKLSVVMPITYSILADPADTMTLLKMAGILSALVAVFMTIYRKKTLSMDRSVFLYPLVLFIGMGLVDSSVKFAQLKYIRDDQLAIFSAILFFIAFLSGILFAFTRKKYLISLLNRKAIKWGILLGISNFGSIYFIIRALNFRDARGMGIDSSVVFGVNNTAIVVLSVLAGYLVFREKLQGINYLGIVLAIASIILFAYA